jgi:hypothetical protein
MKRTKDFTQKVLFSVKWKLMPPEKKYAYLWAKTLRSWSQSSIKKEIEQSETLVGS